MCVGEKGHCLYCAGLQRDEMKMKWEEVKLLKQSGKSTVYLIRDGEQLFVRKVLKGRHPVYRELMKFPHPLIPKLYEIEMSDDETVVIEEYIEGTTGEKKFSERQFLKIAGELCDVLSFLHERGIIHRDIKPSNILFTKDGHIRLIDFDAGRVVKEEREQDTTLLGTRGYAPPEQYGFSQTDARSDIYALGVTLGQLYKTEKRRFLKVIKKCTNLDPNERYQSVKQVKRALFMEKNALLVLGGALAVILPVVLAAFLIHGKETAIQEEGGLIVLPAPRDPHWDGETGLGLWGNVPESGYEDDVEYTWRLYYRENEKEPPKAEDEDWICEVDQAGDLLDPDAYFMENFTTQFEKNGFYYFSVSASGDGLTYADSPYVMSDALAYTGEHAPPLPAPTGLDWRLVESEEGRKIYATWDNLDDYVDTDCFDVWIYDESGKYVMNNIWTKELVLERGQSGMQIRREYISGKNKSYRFTVHVLTSRPNEYASSPMPDPVPEEYYSPWYEPFRRAE